MDLRRLRTFVTVAELGTVSRAALHLRVAQPALSRQIADLESELGLRLFHRVRRRLVLTSEGEQLLGDCRSVLGGLRAIDERAQVLRRGDSGILRVAATPQTIEGVFSSFLHLYAERRPNVRIRLAEAVGPALIEMLERGDLHIGISFLELVRAENHALQSFPLPPVEFIAASRESLGTGSGDLEIERLAGHPLLLLDSSFYVRRTFDAACRLAGFQPRIFMESRAPHALLALAEAGHGVAIVPSVLPTSRYRLQLVRIAHRRRPLREPLAALWDSRRPLPAYATDFCELLAAHMQQLFPITRPTRPGGAPAKPDGARKARVRRTAKARGR